MIAPQRVERTARVARPRTVRAATQRRKGRAARARNAALARICAGLVAALALLMLYVLLTASLTGLSYAVARGAAQREALQEQTIRLDDRLAALRSDARLADVAARLGMQEPQRFAVVHVETARVAQARAHIPILSSLAGFFIPAVAARR